MDDHVSPAAAWVLLDELKEITDKPVRYVINTHFHFDHAHGNQVFDRTVDIIGHEFTRQMLLGGSTNMPLFKNYLAGLPQQVEQLKQRVAAESDTARKTRAPDAASSRREQRPRAGASSGQLHPTSRSKLR